MPITNADLNIIVLDRTKSSGKFAPGMSCLEVIRRISWLQLTRDRFGSMHYTVRPGL